MITHPSTRRSRLGAALLLPLALLLFPIALHAQTNGSITGVLKDAETKAPIAGAVVRLIDATDSTAKRLGDQTDVRGAFTIENVPVGTRYNLEVVSVGYERRLVENVRATAEKPNANVGEIEVRPSAVQGGEVKVTAERPQVTITADKTVYGVENNTAYTATTISELLGQIPSIEVDQDGKISLRGDDNVTIMMNGRPIMMPAEQRNKFLQSLPANSVKNVEIRTNPGAQFDAKYQGGIINIVTRRTISDMVGGNVNAGIDTRLGVNGGLGLYYNGEDLNASLGGGYHRGSHDGSSNSLRLNYRDSIERRDSGIGSSDSKSNSFNGYGQIDYKITENDLFSVSFNLNNWESDYTMRGNHTFFDFDGDVVGTFIDSNSPGKQASNSGGYNSASALLRHTFSGDHKISLDFSYDQHGYKGESNYSGAYYKVGGEFDSIRSSSRNTIYDRSSATYITSLDYENPISDTLTISLGAKNEINALDNSTSVSIMDRQTGEFVVDTLQTNHYLPKNTIWALYANVAYKLSDALTVQAGGRVEHATVAASYASGTPILTRDYTNFFPSGSLGYNVDPTQSVTFSYRRSVALPDIDALNPTKIKWNDFTVSSGNPELEPEFTQSFELNYHTFWGMGNMVSIGPYYSTTAGSIEQSEQLINGVTHMTSANFDGTYSLGTEATIALRPWQWLTFRVSGNVYNKVNRGSELPGDIYSSAIGYSGNAFISADITEGLNFGMNMFGNIPPQVGGSKRSGHMYMSFSLRQRLLDNKLNIMLRVNDPFGLQKWESIYDTPEYYNQITSKWSSRFVGLNLSYTFGTTPRMEQHQKEKSETKGSSGSGNTGGGGQ